MHINARGVPATDVQVHSEGAQLLDRRAALKHPPYSLTVSDSVALGIARLFRSRLSAWVPQAAAVRC